MTLSQEQLTHFNENGFLILRNFYDKEKCQAILDVAKVHIKHKIEPIETELGYHMKSKEFRSDVADYRSKELKEQTTIRRLRQVYDRDILFKEWMENKEIRPILKEILKDEVVITLAHHNSIMSKIPPFSTKTEWHQDRRYWHYSDDNLVSIWLALGEENAQNGVLEFIPKSHTMHFSAEQFDEKEYFKERHPLNMSLIETKVSSNLEAGDVVLFHCKLLHRANKNSTSNPKISFVYTVKGAKTKALKGSRSTEYREILLD